jgi:hypothetical protein
MMSVAALSGRATHDHAVPDCKWPAGRPGLTAQSRDLHRKEPALCARVRSWLLPCSKDARPERPILGVGVPEMSVRTLYRLKASESVFRGGTRERDG